MSYQTDRSRVSGLGSAKKGTEHWVSQRVSAIALIPLAVLFLYTFIGTLGDGHAAMVEKYAEPIPAIIAVMFILVLFRHLRLGVQVVIEDYISDHTAQLRMLILNMLVWRGVAVLGLFAIAKIAFSA